MLIGNFKKLNTETVLHQIVLEKWQNLFIDLAIYLLTSMISFH